MTTSAKPSPLSEGQLTQFEEQGFVILRGVIPEEVLSGLREVFADVVERLARQWKDEGFVEDTHDDLPFEKRFAAIRAQLPPRFPTSWRKILVSRPVYELWQRPELLGPVRSLVGDEVYAHGVWNGRPREPHTEIQRVLWHQDAHYYKGWQPEDGKLISTWLPLVPVDARSGCLQMMAGSHRAGYAERIRGFNNLFTVPDSALEGYDAVTGEMEPGDVLLFGDLTLHQALHNESDYVRWSIDIRFGTATPEIISKTPRGYYCFSAEDPTRVESFEQWQARYDYDEVGLDAEIENFDSSVVDLDDVAKKLHISRSELEVF